MSHAGTKSARSSTTRPQGRSRDGPGEAKSPCVCRARIAGSDAAANTRGGAVQQIAGGIPLCAIGRPLGGSWLYTPKSSETWAHEMGHHRHFQHAQAYAGKNRIAPGGQVKQHDSATHPLFTAACLTNWQKAWDRFCIMSYDKGANRSFCGKCILKNRGWPVEDIPNPSGDIRS